MHSLPIILALLLPAAPALAAPAAPVQATLAERSSAFSDLAECRASLAGPKNERGSVFNRAQGNETRCELVDGEPAIIVTPRDMGAAPR